MIEATSHLLSASLTHNAWELTYQQSKALAKIHEFLQPKNLKSVFLLAGYAGTGKAQPIKTPVLTPTGWKPIGDLKAGDSVISSDGTRTKVLAIFPQGIKPVARVTFSDGSSTRCCYEHLWLTESHSERAVNRVSKYKADKKGKIYQLKPGRVKTTYEIAQSLTARKGTHKNHKIPVMQCADFESSSVPVEPYLLGCLLGDGGLTQGTPKLTTTDSEIAERCGKLVPQGIEMKSVGRELGLTYAFIGTTWKGQFRYNQLTQTLRNLGLWNKYSYEKYIPNCYLINSKKVRLELLRGLMDTDGSVSKKGYETLLATSSLQLGYDVKSLVESLGGICRIREKNTASGRLCYCLSICLPPDINPFHLSRKRDRVKPKTRYIPTRYIISAENAGEEECVCIAVEHPSHLYVTEHCIVTHNTTCVQQLIRELLVQDKRVAVTAPTNKAVGVLQRTAAENGVTGVEFFTIHQLLGLGMVTRGKEKVLDQTGPSYINLFDVVFIDECSMIGKQLWRWIENVANQSSTWTKLKIILMGDPAQLNPVNEGKSPSFQVPDKAVLTQVVRQGTGSPLLEFVTASRYAVTKSKFPFEPYANYLPDKSNGALMVKRQTLLRYACKKMSKEFAKNPDCFRILSWTNAQVDFYNQQIRTYLYGEDANRFISGERLITRDPVMAPDGKTAILSTSMEFTVLDAFVDRYNNYNAWRLKIKTDDGIVRQIYVLHEDEQTRFDQETKRLLKSAKRNPFLWKQYYRHIEQFANVRNCFALTVHNSQGSTFLEAGIDGQDLSKRLNPERGDNSNSVLAKIREFNRLYYVASSRARQRILVIR
ncbi:homing endonuclease-like protein (plasmid) [Cylindrospermum stagnale PCC 7417]|uniref:Homing endonuclease-like protein n=1 Tax=Cylindrospermum stagnale PCC 7417 TaxID=56107 RepID=K9X6U5_9NOST|nr:AAA family ATPase [Cylindrospermum stagnale]AFZ28360.1 homing endonuclease-like protein [Cylindrospermum stagnale PCC 7417]